MSFVLGLIPARGGSKGIKNKNIAQICGKPLIAYTIEAARGSSVLDDLVLSTDSPDIAAVAAQHGLSSGALRPAHLATDEAKSADFIRHEIEQYERREGRKINTLVLLQPTTPLRTAEDINNAYKIYRESGQKTLISCYDGESVHPVVMYKKEGTHLVPFTGDGKIIRRQEFPPVYVRNGAFYIMDRDYFMETGRTVSDTPAFYEMPRRLSVNIDEPADIELAEFFLQKRAAGTL
jgi:CMP-N,N'-diacetyllegionaminic acid synthase